MAPDSKTRMGLPSVKVSVKAGMRPFGLTGDVQWRFYNCLSGAIRTVQKPLLLLSVLGDIDLGELVGQTDDYISIELRAFFVSSLTPAPPM